MTDDVDQARDAGVDHHVIKPVDPREIAGYLRNGRQAAEAGGSRSLANSVGVAPQRIGVRDDPAGAPRRLRFCFERNLQPPPGDWVIRLGSSMKQQHRTPEISLQTETEIRHSDDAASTEEHLETCTAERAVRAFSGSPDATVVHIDPATHEQCSSGKVHSYRADYTVGEDAIMWMAEVEVGRTSRTFAGSVPLTSAGVVAVAEQAVRDAVVRAIDGLDEASR